MSIKNLILAILLTPIAAILTAIVFALLACLIVIAGAVATIATPMNLFNHFQQKDWDRRKLGMWN